MSKWVHKILSRNERAELVECAVCGWVVGYRRAGVLICSVSRKESKKRHREKVKANRPPRETGPKLGALKRSQGYVREWTGEKWVLQHRLVMSRILGRDLLPHENVHHINGDRADNRATNLELWSSSQPPGQRVADKVQWAKEILELYGD